MIPLLIFLVACAGVYLGAIEASFSALMRLSLRLAAERSGRDRNTGNGGSGQRGYKKPAHATE